ncbi:hypothetical protein [Magnetospirillum sulfuroxidans]|uniref:Uncharacterized protein n=1 Tax=Magnetospirillum sulfuroxidans TaxID=611300 RepID=A0ABS5ICW9_9PROT|nr:hypothetical protein [Magnetospirillum sulfuroxidans]MBR9972012.1 hypothetical protein [Magnetospirillum sulfuroxidans]
MRVASFVLIAATALAGCAEAPFVEREINSNVDKPINNVTTNGTAIVCHADSAPWAAVEAEAADACGQYGYFSRFVQTRRYQCRITAPHQSTFACYHPDMTDAKGVLINPSDEKAVLAWQKRTGKLKPKPRIALPEDQQIAPPPATLPNGPLAPQAAPPLAAGSTGGQPAFAAPPPSYRPLTPADIAGKPDMEAAPILAEPPPVVPLYPAGGGYSLPPGSWGQHFEQ